ncbi:MAG TPA: 2-polyprenyl-3-methyl-6-methoxy-1,4-benzoquinone monooxygenase [Pseudomonadales bacterium]
MSQRHYNLVDRLISHLDEGLKTLTSGAHHAARELPASHSSALEQQQQRHVAGLMRINHTGEVCAQALYQGQALTARNQATREAMQSAADEEIDHLVWCEQRLQELGSHTSVLNPLFYGMSFAIGAVTGAIGDRVSLGFVEATEDQVCKHLQDHLQQLPADDHQSRAILQQMLEDEQKHGHMALENGGVSFPQPVKRAMSLLSKVMTGTTYRL